MVVRKCWKCLLWKAQRKFYKGQSKCIKCDKEYYRENRDRILAVKRQWYVNNRDQRAAYLSRVKRERIL